MISFIYYIYEYLYNIYPKNKNEYTIEQKKNMISKIKTFKKEELTYILNGCVDYDKLKHEYHDKNNFNISNLSNIEINKLIQYSILNTDNENNNDDEMINELKEYIMDILNIKFKNTKHDRFLYLRWGINFIYFHYRPLFLNLATKIVVNIFHYYMIFNRKYDFYKCKNSNISYLYKNNNKKENMLFIHGFGIGYVPYVDKIKYLENKYNIIIFIMPTISGYYYGCVPTKEIIINSVNDFMNVKNIIKYNILAHSFGTYVGQLLLNNDISNKINKIIYIDPIIFWITCFRISNFNKKDKYFNNINNKNLFGKLIFFMVNLDIYINHVCFRLMKPFDFLILEPNDNILYFMSKDDYLLDMDILYERYKDYKNIIFLENTAHGDVLLSSKYDKFMKEIINFY